jgi:hypothetical protein
MLERNKLNNLTIKSHPLFWLKYFKVDFEAEYTIHQIGKELRTSEFVCLAHALQRRVQSIKTERRNAMQNRTGV